MSYKNLLETIGNTPIVLLSKFSNSKVKILAKLEGVNPSGSVKDRIAKYIVANAEKKGILTKDKILIEVTSGNTGISLAMISAFKGYKFMAVMPKSVSQERRKLLKAYGAKVYLTKAVGGTNYAIQIAKNLLKENKNFLILDQFSNKANVKAHYQSTGEEIIKQTLNITHFVAGMGTGGTLMGVGKRLKEFNPKIKVIGIEPKKPNSQIQGLRNMQAYKPPIFKEELLDEKLLIDDEPAFELAKELFKKEGLSVGISSGAALWGALEIAKKIKKGIIITLFPDRGDKYFSTKLFRSPTGKC